MKKLSLLGIVLLMCLSITACGNNQSTENSSSENENSVSENAENTDNNTDNNSENQNENSENASKNDSENTQPDSENENNTSSEKFDVQPGGKEWPTADFIDSGMKYEGSGDIVATEYVNEGDGDKKQMIWCIYYSGSTLDDVKNYVNKLKNSGFKYYGILNDEEPEAKFEDGLYYWMGESSEKQRSAMIYLCEEPDTYKNPENNEEKQFNLVIQLCNTTVSELFK